MNRRQSIRLFARRSERGAAMIESLIAMMLLLLVLFGILQLTFLVAADMFTDYSAFRAARSASVGFCDELVEREALARVAPVSGEITFPSEEETGIYGRGSVEGEKNFIADYMDGSRDLEYEYWDNVNVDVTRSSGTVASEVTFSPYPFNVPFHSAFHHSGKDGMEISGKAEMTNHAKVFLK